MVVAVDFIKSFYCQVGVEVEVSILSNVEDYFKNFSHLTEVIQETLEVV